ncbi:unnamed protein product [Protopolystoma xenopodis]|uniref:Plectin/eS10 N-terminal domain-containing protein n=1 Tax=Protopolystoma xenopodis TaxID=117903 RepID=A0A448XFD1_9PLAT|nr:unnamed protein product [Protopolystoma xenopodis]
MLLPIATRNAIYEHLFQEGVMTACKDVRPLSKHPRLDIRNLYVVKTLKSLHSRGFVLHLPSDIIPATLKPAIKDIRQMPPGIEPPQPRGQDGLFISSLQLCFIRCASGRLVNRPEPASPGGCT